MNPIFNPFCPGAGTPPPELAGHDELREMLRIALEHARIGRPAKSAILVGLRGVGKTVLLDRVHKDAEAAGIHTVRIEAPERRSLPALLAPQLRQALLRLSQGWLTTATLSMICRTCLNRSDWLPSQLAPPSRCLLMSCNALRSPSWLRSSRQCIGPSNADCPLCSLPQACHKFVDAWVTPSPMQNVYLIFRLLDH